MTTSSNKSRVQPYSPIPIATAKAYLRILAWSGIVITTVATLILIFYAGFQPPWSMVAAVIGTDIVVLLLLQRDRVEWAIHLFTIAAFAILVQQSISSHDAFLLATAGFVALVLTVLVILPGRQWMFAIAAALALMLGISVWYVQMAETAIDRVQMVDAAIWQMTVFVASSGAIAAAFQSIMRANNQRVQALEALRQSEMLARKHSAELQASNSALLRSEKRYRSLIEAAKEAILLCEFPTLKILDANSASLDLFDYSVEQLHSRALTNLATGPKLDTQQRPIDEAALLAELKRGQLVAFEQCCIDSAGRQFLCHLRMTLLPDDQNKVRITIADVDEQRAAERRERELVELLQLVSDNVPVRIAYIDARKTDLKIRFWNKSFADIFDLGDLSVPADARLVFGDFLYRQYQQYFKKTLAGETVQFESFASDGSNGVASVSFLPHMVEGSVVGIFAVAVDVTAERHAKQSLAETTELLQFVTDNMPARLMYLDVDGRICFVNKQFEAMGIDRKVAVGMKPEQLLSPSMLSGMSGLPESHQKGESLQFERNVKLHSGEERIETIVSVPHIVDNHVQGNIVLISDVTELRRTEAAFHRAQKAESLGVMAGGIAHDFNNLLLAILGQNSLAMAKLDHTHAARRHVEKSIRASERAVSLTNQILAYSGRGAFEVEPLNINTIIQENLNLFRVSLPSNVEFSLGLADGLPLIKGDPVQMQQVVMNLIINAGQALGNEQGTVLMRTNTIDLSAKAVQQLVLVEGQLEPGRYVVVSVCDTGVGMDAETRQRVFEPFFTTKETGTGLGLAAVLGIVRGHDGGIVLESTVGSGTTFLVYLPVLETPVFAVPDSAEFYPKPASEKSLTVLVIDDEAPVSNVVADILETASIQAIEFNEPLDAIEYYRAHDDEIDLVILDLMMPKMNGMEVFYQLQLINPDVRVLLSSGYSREDVVSRFVVSGVTDFIQKPYTFDQLLARVHEIFERELI